MTRDGSPGERPGEVVLRPRGERGSPVPGAGILGLTLFMVSLSMLFASGLVAWFVVRARAYAWPPAAAPPLPAGMWLSTAALVGASIAVQRALGGVRAGNPLRLRRSLTATWLFALTFCASQISNWILFAVADESWGAHLYGFGFFMLTGLHAAHVLGGLILLGVVTRRAGRGDYDWSHYPGVRYAAVYWHFLGAVWLVLFAVMRLTG